MSQLDCKWNLECFSLLDPEKCKEIGKIREILFAGPRTEDKFKEMTKRVVRNSEIFPRKYRSIFGGPRTETKFVKWSASRKRLRTAELGHQAYSPIIHVIAGGVYL